MTEDERLGKPEDSSKFPYWEDGNEKKPDNFHVGGVVVDVTCENKTTFLEYVSSPRDSFLSLNQLLISYWGYQISTSDAETKARAMHVLHDQLLLWSVAD